MHQFMNMHEANVCIVRPNLRVLNALLSHKYGEKKAVQWEMHENKANVCRVSLVLRPVAHWDEARAWLKPHSMYEF